MKKSIVNGIAFSVSQAMIYFAYAVLFHLGGYLVEKDGLPFEDIIV